MIYCRTIDNPLTIEALKKDLYLICDIYSSAIQKKKNVENGSSNFQALMVKSERPTSKG